MFQLEFNTTQNIYLFTGLFFVIFSISHFFISKNNNKSIRILLIGTFFLSLFAITLDPFLNTWDEQYHALVAKNLSITPLHPRLFPEPVLPYSIEHWTANYTWVHKQPWFLWQMALFIKLFGASELTIRIPSLLCFVFAAFCVYKIGKNLLNPTIGFLGALLWSCNFYFYQLMSGGHPTDQNDVIFVCYTTFSFWAFSEYLIAEKKTKWVILIGIFTGIAVLTKWLSGLIVFSAYGIYTVLNNWPKFYKIKIYTHIFASLLIAAVIAASWQIYIHIQFPAEAKFEFSMMSKHFKEVVENHQGTKWFYLDNFPIVYGKLALYFFIPSLVTLYKYFIDKKHFFSMISLVIITYAFFSIAKTKMIGFPLICSSVILLSMASLMYLFITKLQAFRIGKIIAILSVFSTAILTLRSHELSLFHSFSEKNGVLSNYRANKIYWTKVFKDLPPPPQKSVLFNCPYDIYIESMFYTDFVGGYTGLPWPNQIDIIKKSSYKICIFDDGNLNPEIKNNKNFTVITAPQFHIIKTDTVSILNSENLTLTTNSYKQPYFIYLSNPTKHIIDYFEDGSCRIKLLTGECLTFNITGKGSAYFGNAAYSCSNRFYMVKQDDNLMRLTTPFNTDLKMDKNSYLVFGDDKFYLPLKIKLAGKK